MNFAHSFLTLSLIALSIQTNAQKIKLEEGSIEILKQDSSFNFEFTYDNMSVGRYEKEADYITTKTAALNEKQAGRGEAWAKKWISSRAEDYEPIFIDMFTALTRTSAGSNAKYTFIFHTISTEPGYDVMGGISFGSSKSATINATLTIVETTNRSKKIAVITIEKAAGAPGATFSGTTTAEGNFRITEAYRRAGKDLAKFFKRNWE